MKHDRKFISSKFIMTENFVPKAFELCASDNIEEFKKIVPERVKLNAKVFFKIIFF